jgi:DNA-binding transcriptional regulator YiaG
LTPEQTIEVILHRTGALDRGITVARRLFAAGLTLKQAHDAINRLAELGWTTCAIARSEDLAALAGDLANLNVELRRRRGTLGEALDIAALRARYNLSQRQYADLLAIDVRTLQNWEQGRNRPDPAAITLMRVFDRSPDVVEEALTEPVLG